jgi:uncharacterized membrane protein YphA (DoxX/SURF4 family)
MRLSVGGWLILFAIGFVIGLFTLNFALMGSAILAAAVVLGYGMGRAQLRHWWQSRR